MEIKSIEDWNALLTKAECGDTKAMNEVASCLQHGLMQNGKELIAVDEVESFNWTKKAFELGDLEATLAYAHYLTDKENTVCEPDISLGMRLYHQCFEKGSLYAAYCLGLEYRNLQQFDKAFEYYLKSEQNDEFYQELTTALCYFYGVGVCKDKLQALNRLLRINRETHTQYEFDEANYLIGTIYLEGEVVAQDLDKARYHLELADIDGDHRSAQELLITIGRMKSLNR